MADNSSLASTSTSDPIYLPSSLSIPSSFRRTQSSKIENLVEYSYVLEDAQIQFTNLPFINPYNIYRRDSSITRSIRSLISTRRPHAKEYVQTSKIDQCSLRATSAEQYVTLEIPPHFVAKWKQEGYTHFHLGAVRIILSLHRRKGLPVTARVNLLDTRFLKFEHAVIGTVLKTLNVGSIMLTFFPNFNLSLHDPNLLTTFKIQVQLIGAEQISTAVAATVHHQLIYRLQNHALDMPTPGTSSEALFLIAENDDNPTIVQIPRQCPFVFHISMLSYIPHDSHVLQPQTSQVRDDLSYEEQPVKILDSQVRKLRSKEIPLVKVLWHNHSSS